LRSQKSWRQFAGFKWGGQARGSGNPNPVVVGFVVDCIENDVQIIFLGRISQLINQLRHDIILIDPLGLLDPGCQPIPDLLETDILNNEDVLEPNFSVPDRLAKLSSTPVRLDACQRCARLI